MEVLVNKLCSFIGDRPIISDARGVFYSKDSDNVIFNLPPGKYDVSSAEYYGPPVIYKQPFLPFPERINFRPNNLKILIADTVDNKPISQAAISRFTDEIFVRSNINDLDTVSIMCILMHEMGHYHYKTEEYCDRFAFYHLLRTGYNPSQFKVFIDLLSSWSMDRMKKAITYLEKIDEQAIDPFSPKLRRLFVL